MKRIISGIALAFVGWAIGCQVDMIWSWIGPAIGFTLGLVFGGEGLAETKQILRESWQNVSSWRPNKELVKMKFHVFLYLFLFPASWIVVTFLVFMSSGGEPSYPYGWQGIGLSVCAIFITYFSIMLDELMNDSEIRLRDRKYEASMLLKFGNPISLSVFLVYYTAKSVLWIFRRAVPFIFWTAPRFILVATMNFVAREKRLTFAISVAVGSGLGLFLGHTLACGIAGSLFAGFLIFVSDKMRAYAESRACKTQTATV